MTTRAQKRMRDYFNDDLENNEIDNALHQDNVDTEPISGIRNSNGDIISEENDEHTGMFCELRMDENLMRLNNGSNFKSIASTEHDIDTRNQAKRKKTSDPRLLDGKYFKIEKREGNKVEAICVTCGITRKGDVTSTGNFMEHMKKSHPTLVQSVEKYRKFGLLTNSNENKKQATLDELCKNFTHEEVGVSLMVLFETCIANVC